MKSHKCEVCLVEFKQDFHLHQHIRSKSHSNKVEEVLSRGEPVPDHLVIQADTAKNPDLQSFVVPNLEQVFQPQPMGMDSTRTKFNDEDLVDLADTTSASELFLDDPNIKLIIVNEANRDVMLMTSSSSQNEVKLSDAATEDSNLMSMSLETE